VDKTERLRSLPGIDRILATDAAKHLKVGWSGAIYDDEVRALVAELRARIQDGADPGTSTPAELAEQAGARLARRLDRGVRRCINATGVVLHTGLGRAALPAAAIEAIEREIGSGYSVVSINREEGTRIRRESAVARLLCALTGAEAATVVNNNAAATLIGLNTLAGGREAILSRGQLVEIGGSFRMPDVFVAAGVALREVGTTNRTRASDYEAAIGDQTGLLLRVHPSNFKVIGFTEEVDIAGLVELGRKHRIPVMDDLGAGALVALPPEPVISDSLKAGADLLTCSGDKLIGGPQSGIILGRRIWVDRVRRNPLFRTLRVDKLTLAALEATLRLFLRRDGPGADHPTLHMLQLSLDAIAKRARTLRTRLAKDVAAVGVEIVDGYSQVGSGSLPGENLPTKLLSIAHPTLKSSAFAKRLRLSDPPIYTRIVDDKVCLDPRTLRPGDDKDIVRILQELTR